MIRRFVFLVAFTLAVTPLPARAQSSPEPGTSPPAPAQAQPPRVTAGSEGFAFESGSGDFRLQLGVLAHADGRFALDDTNEQFTDTFVGRRLRPYLRGRLTRNFEFYVNPDFAASTLVVQDAYIDTILSPSLRLRFGKAKTPFGFERLHPASNMLFLERAFPTALAPNRDIGIQVLGDLTGGVIGYMAGVMNGVADGGSADTDSNDGKDLSGRLIVRPFSKLATTHPLRGLGVAISGSTGEATGTAGLPTFRTQTLQQTYFSYVTGATPAVADGTRNRYSPQVWLFSGPFAGWYEYVHTETPIRRGDVASDIAHDAWQIAASWVLTGEAATDAGAGLRPRNSFDPANGRWGAVQLAARYHELEVDEGAITLGFAAPGASRQAEAWTVGVRWYLTGNVWQTLNFERTVFDDDPNGPRHVENALAFRAQISF